MNKNKNTLAHREHCDGGVVRTFAFHQCGPGLFPGLGDHMWVAFGQRGCSLTFLVLLSPPKPTFPNFNLIRRVLPISVLCANKRL